MANEATPRLTKSAKRYPPHVNARLVPMSVAVVVLLVLSMFLQTAIDPTIRVIHKGDENFTNASAGLNNEFLLLPLLGFREAAAGLLWVRCDEFFHSGDYDAILPLVRLITWLDPHADNVYITGAWHLAYNFTDSSERSDRRYIAPSQALLAEGIRNNMNIPDIKFEKGWQCYDKMKDFVASEDALKLALNTPATKKSDDYPYGAPLKVLHTLAHCYEKQGKIPEALAVWQAALTRSNEMITAKKDDYSTKQLRSAEQHNYDETLQRYRDRYTSAQHDPKINPTTHPGVLGLDPKVAPAPWNVSFRPEIEVERPKVLKIKGNFNSADGARVDVRITDWDYKERQIGAKLESFDVDSSQTILVDSIAVRKTHFEREMDMSKDPKMYSFSTDSYRITLSYNPRTTSPFLHDRYGWSGEGITDGENPSHVFVDPNPVLLGTKLIEGYNGNGPLWDGKTIPQWITEDAKKQPVNEFATHSPLGQPPRLIRVVFKVSRDQIMGRKPITDSDIVPNA